MAKTCACESGLSNTGVACSPIMQVAQKLIFNNRYDNNGSVNEIDIQLPMDQGFFEALVNDVNKTERWYPTPNLKSVTDERGEPMMESFPDGSMSFIQDGTRGFIGFITGIHANQKLVGKLNAIRCQNMQVYIVDKNGNLIGIEKTKNMLAGIRIDSDSFNARLIKGTDTTTQKVEIKFNFHVDENDEDLVMVTASEMQYSISDLSGLLDITTTLTGISTTGLTVTLETEYGTILNPVMDEGLDASNFISSVTSASSRFRNVTDAADVTITSVEIAPGVYNITFNTAQGAGETMVCKPKKNGREYVNTPFVI